MVRVFCATLWTVTLCCYSILVAKYTPVSLLCLRPHKLVIKESSFLQILYSMTALNGVTLQYWRGMTTRTSLLKLSSTVCRRLPLIPNVHCTFCGWTCYFAVFMQRWVTYNFRISMKLRVIDGKTRLWNVLMETLNHRLLSLTLSLHHIAFFHIFTRDCWRFCQHNDSTFAMINSLSWTTDFDCNNFRVSCVVLCMLLVFSKGQYSVCRHNFYCKNYEKKNRNA